MQCIIVFFPYHTHYLLVVLLSVILENTILYLAPFESWESRFLSYNMMSHIRYMYKIIINSWIFL